MKSLVIGMGIGNLYHEVLTNLGYEIVTVDQDATKNADFTNTIGLIQPKVKGAKGFWAVKYIENKE